MALTLSETAVNWVCYAGYDINNKQSGTSVNTKARISHKGNKHIRKALYFPALTAVQHDQPLSNFYNRLFDRQKIKMKSYVAVQRKLLILIYTLWKKEKDIIQKYYKDKFLLEAAPRGRPNRAGSSPLLICFPKYVKI